MTAVAPYTYNAVVLSVHDGDTLTVRVDLGFDTYRTQVVRLVGINAIELRQPGGVEARDYLNGLIWPGHASSLGVPVTLISVRYDKYGNRVDGDVLFYGESLSQRMVADGYAAPWNGKGKAPVPAWPIPEATP